MNHYFRNTRAACMTAIGLVWSVEVLVLIGLVIGGFTGQLGSISPDAGAVMWVLVLLVALLSFAVTGFATGVLAGAVANIDAVRIQWEHLEIAREAQDERHASAEQSVTATTATPLKRVA